jgi:hypothetical protein
MSEDAPSEIIETGDGPDEQEPIRRAVGEKWVSDDAKRRIVVELARFRKAKEVLKILKDEYGITSLELRNIYLYDASKSYCFLGAPLRELFHATRKHYCESMTDLEISQTAFRLRALQRYADKAEEQGNYKLAAAFLEQAARDFGGQFTNVQHLTGQFEHNHKMTVDEARGKIEAARARLISQRAEVSATVQ